MKTPYRKVASSTKLADKPQKGMTAYHVTLECGHEVRLRLAEGSEFPPSLQCRNCREVAEIVAAHPDLLAACQQAKTLLSELGGRDVLGDFTAAEVDRVSDQIAAAIHKATTSHAV